MRLRKLTLVMAYGITLLVRVYAQEPCVPTKVKFADMQLLITPAAQEKIQEKIHCLVRSPKHYQTIFDRVTLYMPIIERVIREEGLPEDFKYLAIQESCLVADEVSTANAVGFWQMKQAAASEVGLRMDRYIDERMHITTATRGAAQYIKSHHTFFHNWLYALLAFYLGRTGAQQVTDQQYLGAKKMQIDQHTHWYILHFLAHKLVFENAIGQARHPELYLHECNHCQGKTLREISQQFKVTQRMLRAYNKWLKPRKVPEDATCAVIIPLTHQQYAPIDTGSVQDALTKYKINYTAYWDSAKEFPVVGSSPKKPAQNEVSVSQFNGIAGIRAQPGDDLTSLARAGHLSLKQFLDYNDIDQTHRVEAGQVYYFKTKKRKAGVHYHIVRPSETWWSVAQKYGLKKAALLSKNRVRQATTLEPGRVLWLRFIRPANIPIAYAQAPSKEHEQAPSKTGAKRPTPPS